MSTIRIGIVGLGANTRLRHVPGLRACEDVEIVSVCNRTPESTARVAAEFDIPKTHTTWSDVVADPDVDAVVIGTWPYLHCEVTLAALQASKHVLTEARMAMNADEARRMHEAAAQRPDLTAQIVPSPLGLRGGQVMREMIDQGFLGELREVVVLACNNSLMDAGTPLHWRQSRHYSGLNTLTLGIVHEPLARWVPDPVHVEAHARTFVQQRMDPETGQQVQVEVPDLLRLWTELPGGACGLYHISSVMHHGPGTQIHLYGTSGTIKYLLAPEDQIFAGRATDAQLAEVEIAPEKAGHWRVEEEFIDGIRGVAPIALNDFTTGVRYMEFTEAVAQSVSEGKPIEVSSAIKSGRANSAVRE